MRCSVNQPVNQLSPRALFRASRPRDRQRSRVYQWERAAQAATKLQAPPSPDLSELASIQLWLNPIWRAERGRYGLAKVSPPTIQRPHWGQRRGLAFDHNRSITLPRWARQPWMVLHEMAHHLTPNDEAHGGRFVGVLIGLLARHTGRSAATMLELAQEHGIRVDLRSVGSVPAEDLSPAQRLLNLLPATDMDLACELDLHWRQVRGLALGLIRRGQARWYRGKLVRVQQ